MASGEDTKVYIHDVKIEELLTTVPGIITNDTQNFPNHTLSYLEEFTKFLKEIDDNDENNEVGTSCDHPLLSLASTEDVLSSIHNVNANIESAIDSMACENASMVLPILTFKDANKILSSMEANENGIYDDNVMALSRNNPEQVNPGKNKFENNNNENKTSITNDTETDKIDTLNITEKDILKMNLFIDKPFDILDHSMIETSEILADRQNDMIENSTSDILNTDENQLLSEIVTKKFNNLETISMKNDNNIDDFDCDGYNSSDFEFIDESEAFVGGILKNRNEEVESCKLNTSKIVSNVNKIYNFTKHSDSSGSSYKSIFNTVDSQIEVDHRNSHVIPENDNYLELFAQPWTVYHCEAENKAFHSSMTMDIETDDIGFNVDMLQRLHQEKNVDAVFEEEAQESTKRILSMYPLQNRKRRRRF